MQGTVVKEVEHNYMSEMGGNIRLPYEDGLVGAIESVSWMLIAVGVSVPLYGLFLLYLASSWRTRLVCFENGVQVVTVFRKLELLFHEIAWIHVHAVDVFGGKPRSVMMITVQPTEESGKRRIVHQRTVSYGSLDREYGDIIEYLKGYVDFLRDR